ncbi:hypothetical protein V8G58_00005, partial [Gaetbulibacter aestuarii]
ASVDTNTTNTGLAINGTNLTLTDSDGNTVSVPLADIDTNTTNTSLAINGTNLTLTDSDGNTVSVPLADIDTNTTNSSLIIEGDNLKLTDSDNNVVSVTLPAINETTTSITQSLGNEDTNVTGNTARTIASYTDEAGNSATINETITTFSQNPDGTYTYSNESGTEVSFAVAEPWFGFDDDSYASDNTEDIYMNGRVAIGVNPSAQAFTDFVSNSISTKLFVNGAIETTTSYYADYVFEKYLEGKSTLKSTYAFKTLPEVENFIKINKHLPGVSSIKDIGRTEDGKYSFNISELSVQLLEKVEELYLHTIEQQKALEEKDHKINELEGRLARIEALLNVNK